MASQLQGFPRMLPPLASAARAVRPATGRVAARVRLTPPGNSASCAAGGLRIEPNHFAWRRRRARPSLVPTRRPPPARLPQPHPSPVANRTRLGNRHASLAAIQGERPYPDHRFRRSRDGRRRIGDHQAFGRAMIHDHRAHRRCQTSIVHVSLLPRRPDKPSSAVWCSTNIQATTERIAAAMATETAPSLLGCAGPLQRTLADWAARRVE